MSIRLIRPRPAGDVLWAVKEEPASPGRRGLAQTTLFNVGCGFQKADDGVVTLDGHDTSGDSPGPPARLGFGRTFQRIELFSSITVRENVELAAEAIHVGDDPLTQLGLIGLAPSEFILGYASKPPYGYQRLWALP
jgi:ABC-type molybdate transport system ATPase subunit